MDFYVDTSGLVGLYLVEATSDKARELVSSLNSPVTFTPLHRLELRNTIRRAVFQRRISTAGMSSLLRNIENHEHEGVYAAATPAWNEVYARADAISASHTPSQGNRALDILHVASALVLGVREFYTFDQDQADLARAVGLKVFPKR